MYPVIYFKNLGLASPQCAGLAKSLETQERVNIAVEVSRQSLGRIPSSLGQVFF